MLPAVRRRLTASNIEDRLPLAGVLCITADDNVHPAVLSVRLAVRRHLTAFHI